MSGNGKTLFEFQTLPMLISGSATTTMAEQNMTDDLLQAINLTVAGQWDAAHRIVQQYDADPVAAWIHAVLHKIEGDLDNSRYWYRRAGKMDCVDREPLFELETIKAAMSEEKCR